MRKRSFRHVVAMLLAVMMVIGLLPMNVMAAPVTLPESMPLVSDKESTLAPGIELHEIVSYSGDGERVEMYATIADLKVDTVEIYANYKDNTINEGWGFQTPADQAAAFEANHPGKQVVAATNGSYYNLTTGEPEGVLVMEGVEAIKSAGDSNHYPFFAILKDGTPYIGQAWTYDSIKSNVKEAVAGKRLLVWNGTACNLTGQYDYGDPGYKYPRNAIGVTADGKVVTLLADGYRAPYSDGTTLDELAALMVELGCVAAVQLDGGGSGSLSTKPEGSDELVLTSTPGDGGYARKVANSIMIVSTAAASDVFHHADLKVENDYVTPQSTVPVTVTGVSSTGHNAELPADLTLQVKEATMGSIVDGAYVCATGYTGDAVIQAVSGGQVVGEITIHVVIPDKIELSLEKMVVKYGNTKELEVNAFYGLNPVAVKAADFTFTWADNAALGTIDSYTFTASEDMSLTGPVDLVVTLVHNTELKDTVAVSLTDLPDEPVVVTDFEDQVPLYVNPDSFVPSEYLIGKSGIVDSTTGKVHSGDYAFKIGVTPVWDSSPFLQGYFTGRVKVGEANSTGDLDFTQVDLTNAQSFGLWIYIPEDSVIMSSAVNFARKDGSQSIKVRLYDYGYASTEAGHTGWQYFSLDIDEINVANGVTFNDGNWCISSLYITECCSRRPDQYAYQYGYEPADHQSIDGYHEFYLDDIVIEYLDLDIDREDPDFGTMTMSYDEESNVEVKGQTITSKKVSFSVQATDESKLDANSAKAYIDGNAVAVTCDANGTMTVDAQTLADGTHNVMFVIADEHGNTDYVTRQVVIAADSDIPTVTVKGNENNGKDNELLMESLFWLDVEVDNIEDVESIELILNLDSVSGWEFEGMELAYGFTAEYSVDPANNATITITKTGEVERTGHAVIAQIPIRTGALYEIYVPRDKTSTDWNNSALYWLPIDVRVVADKGLVTYEDGTETSFAMENIDVDSELTDWPYVWAGQGYTHKHTAHAIDDKAATCTESGYTDRTFCDVCNSVVEWGTKDSASGHDYELIDGKVKCSVETCGKLLTGEKDGKLYADGEMVQGWVGKLFYVDGVKLTGIAAAEDVYYNFGEDGVSQGKYTGLFQDAAADGKYRYALAGVLKSGWILIEDSWYYFDESYNAASGKHDNFFSGVNYEFKENGKLVSGVWVTNDSGSRYYYGPDYYRPTGHGYDIYAFREIDGKQYCFDVNGYRLEGIQGITKSSDPEWYWYDFGEDGAAEEITTTGFINANGNIIYLENGTSTFKGLFQLDGGYYYQNSKHIVVTGEYYVTRNNDLLPQGFYNFGEDGKMETLNGIVNGYYFVDNVKTYGGLMHMDTDGDGVPDAFYYARTSGQIVMGTSYKITKTNDLMPAGTYTFDETGKMVVTNGIVDGYWYVNNVKTYGGLMHLDTDGDGVADAYYYANSSGKIVTGNYYVTKDNGLLPNDTYNFGEDGQLICTKHVWDEGVVTTEPTYTQDGEKTFTCVICDETKTEAVPKLVCTEHAWDDGVVTTEPTATEEGEKTFTCANCGETKIEAIPATGAEVGEIIRVAGSTRYDTAYAAADTLKETLGVEQFSAIVVASGDQFADALAGSYLAAEKDAPVLLVRDNKDTMKSVKDYIKENLAPGGTVYLLGGKNAVPVAMESDLEGFTVTRLAGADRYATNLEILKEAGVEGKDILVCTGKDFADSLSASAVGLPILLVKDNLNDAQKEFLQGTTGKKIIVGGSNAISYKIEDQLGAYGEVIRLAGLSRYDTSVLVAETFFNEPTQVVVAFAENFPDGLSGGPVANAIGAPLILTKPGKEAVAAEYISRTGISSGYVLGGTAVLPEKTINKVFSAQ